MPDIWITRTEPGAGRSARNWAAAGFAPRVAPVLRTVGVATSAPWPEGYTPVFTSANGVRFAGVDAPRGPAFAVGDATAEAARAAGFAPVVSARGDVEDLVACIPADAGPLLHVRGERVAGDLVGGLRARGLRADSRVVYRTEAVQDLGPPVGDAEWIAVYSPFAAECVVRILPQSWGGRIAALSARCAEPLRARRVVVAERPCEAALIRAALEAMEGRR